MQAGPLQSYLDKWLAAQPCQRQALAFVDGARYPGHLALAALEFELLAGAYQLRDASVAAAKLNWWLEELDGAARTGGRHPLTQLLFDQPQARQLPTEWWTQPVVGALEQLEQGTASDFSSQLAATAPFHGAMARLENAWWYGPGQAADSAATLAGCSHLLAQLGQLAHSRDRSGLPLPMQRLARHHLGRQDLAHASPGLTAAVQEQATDLLAAVDAALAKGQPLSVFRLLQARVDRRSLQQLIRGRGDPVVLATAAPLPRLRTLWQAWQAAREWRRRAAA